MLKIKLLYFRGCPSYMNAKRIIENVLEEKGLKTRISLVEVTKDMDVSALKFVGSPTILIDGIDVEKGVKESFGFGCRIYNTQEGLQGWPSKDMIEKAVDSALRR